MKQIEGAHPQGELAPSERLSSVTLARPAAKRSWHRLLVVLAGMSFIGCGHETLDLVGTLERRIVELAAPVTEVIVEIPVALGDRVSPGQVLVRLDGQVAEADLRAAEAALAAAVATVTETEKEFQRFDNLRRSAVGTAQQLDRARRERDEARALLAEREARVAQAKKRLEDLSIRSHLAGVVDQLPFDVGERVPPGGVMAVVLGGDRPWVRLWLPARAAARIKPGDPARVLIQGLDEWYSGKVDEVSRQPSFTPHYALTERESAHLVYETRVVLTDAPEDLRPGLSARIRLVVGAQADD